MSQFLSPLGLVATMLLLPASAFAQDQTAPATAPASAAAGGVAVEVNKIEPADKGCRINLVVKNSAATPYTSFRVDLVVFQADGIIGKQMALELGPLKADKTAVKRFDIDGLSCDRIGSMLVNDVMDCKAEGASVSAQDCMKALTVSSRSDVKISK